ncbi:MAG: hypothetical protein QOF39_2696 [Frankiales bacterium]|jgi:hypothetical protein|nr:hypothetical protein [Frankiales bacterium]
MNALRSIPPKKAFGVVGGALAVLTGLRDLRKNSGKGRLAMVHTLLKITVAVVGIVVALKAADEVLHETS